MKEAIESWGASVSIGDKNARLVRVSWYEVGSIDEWDLEDPVSVNTLLEWFKLDIDLKKKYLALSGEKLGRVGPDKIAEEAWSICFEEVKRWYLQKKSYVKKSRDFHFGVKSSTDFIDIIPAGHLKVDILHKNITEKGIDTSLAVDMLSLVETYDVALVISGDADSIPSIQKVKQSGKHVGVVEFLKGFPPERKSRQSSSKLKASSDFVVPIYEVDLQKNNVAVGANTKNRS